VAFISAEKISDFSAESFEFGKKPLSLQPQNER
jgi:hypothetical protein